MAVLLSMQDRWQDMQTQHELTAIQTLLKRQYEQYRISRDNSEAINRKYHDLKHQIQVIRMESDAAQKRGIPFATGKRNAEPGCESAYRK